MLRGHSLTPDSMYECIRVYILYTIVIKIINLHHIIEMWSMDIGFPQQIFRCFATSVQIKHLKTYRNLHDWRNTKKLLMKHGFSHHILSMIWFHHVPSNIISNKKGRRSQGKWDHEQSFFRGHLAPYLLLNLPICHGATWHPHANDHHSQDCYVCKLEPFAYRIEC